LTQATARPLKKNPKKVLAMSRRIVNLTSLQLALARNNPSGGIGRSVPRANVGGGFPNEYSTSTISRQGTAGRGWARLGEAGRGAARRGWAGRGKAITRRTGGNSATFSWRGRARQGTAGRGWARRVNHERTGREQVQYFHGAARHGAAGRGEALRGAARQGTHESAGGQQRNIFTAWRGRARRGRARLGRARQLRDTRAVTA